jgi:uncharacterized delta-60 repeat protein
MWFLFRRKPRPTTPRRPSYRPRLEALEDRCVPSTGGLLDPTFGGTGEVSLSPTTRSYSVAVQPQDGKIVSAGWIYNKGVQDMNIVRLNPDGSLDTSFNQTGSVDLSVGYASYASTVALQPDGKILVGGGAYPTHNAYQPPYDGEFVVARLNSNGTLDRTFASRGVFTWNRTSNDDAVNALAVLGDGSIAVVGSANHLPDPGLVFKLSASGALVSSFGSSGAALFPLNSGTQLNSITVAPNGDLIVGGTSYTDTTWSHWVGVLLAVNPSTGRLDPTFNNGQGWVAEAYPGVTQTGLSAVTMQGNSIVAAGTYDAYPGLWGLVSRYSLGGALDTHFGNAGYFTQFTSVSGFGAVALEGDGSIVLSSNYQSTLPMTVTHLTADGQLDSSFGGAGSGLASIQDGAGHGLAIDAAGRIVVSGSGENVVGQEMAFFARLTAPEAMIGSFTASVNPVTTGSRETLTASNITANGGATITQVAFSYLDSSGNQVILGYGTQSSPGVWTLTFTVNLTAGSYTLYAQATASDGLVGDPYSLTLLVQ